MVTETEQIKKLIDEIEELKTRIEVQSKLIKKYEELTEKQDKLIDSLSINELNFKKNSQELIDLIEK